VYHTLFFLDLYLARSLDRFAPPFELDEFSDAEPDQIYTQAQLGEYLLHCRQKCRQVVTELSEDEAARPCSFSWLSITEGELLLYNMRHVQHHAAQLNLLLRLTIDSAPRWVSTASECQP
jgi:uncharacterized damage-inducible protein DinB